MELLVFWSLTNPLAPTVSVGPRIGGLNHPLTRENWKGSLPMSAVVEYSNRVPGETEITALRKLLQRDLVT